MDPPRFLLPAVLSWLLPTRRPLPVSAVLNILHNHRTDVTWLPELQLKLQVNIYINTVQRFLTE